MKYKFEVKNNRYHDQTRIRRNILLLKLMMETLILESRFLILDSRDSNALESVFNEGPLFIEYKSFCFQPRKAKPLQRLAY